MREGLATALEAVVGPAHVLTDDAVAAYAIDGVRPALVALPDDEAQIIDTLRLAAEYQATVFPRGGGSHMSLGHTPTQVDLILSVERLQRQLAYEPADLTTTVQAGIGFVALQQTLQAGGQFLALDPPVTSTTTLGGVVMTNRSGPRRLLYGTARDVVLGTTVITIDGTRVKAGGRVVKNVTGYDVNKLYIGSLGTLGILVELTCKLHPLPPGELTLVVSCAAYTDVAVILPTIMQLPLRLNSLELLNSTACARLAAHAALALPDTAYTLVVRVEGPPEVTESQAQRLTSALQRLALTRPVRVYTCNATERERLWGGLGTLTQGPTDAEDTMAGVVVKVSLLMDALPPFCQTVQEMASSAAMAWSLVAHAGSGIVYVEIPGAPAVPHDVERLLAHLQDLEACVAQHHGHMVVERAPVALKQRWPVWGTSRDDFALMRAIKTSYDPQHRLNPGRFLGGL
jgi:glycolate oxidase FAD binding subunit